jgi:hypothetical protein
METALAASDRVKRGEFARNLAVKRYSAGRV